MRPVAPPADTIGAHGGGQRHRLAQQAHERVEDEEAGGRRDGEGEHRELHAPGRIDEQDVSCADAPKHDERDRRGENREQPEQRSHPEFRSRRDL